MEKKEPRGVGLVVLFSDASVTASPVSSFVPDHPNVWSDGTLVLDKVTGISSSGAGFFADQSVSFLGCS